MVCGTEVGVLVKFDFVEKLGFVVKLEVGLNPGACRG